ncbi:MAG: DUF2505 domain-containing protein [Bifidobacteriaceae bacterium]|jgi:hypothetical protein|nr:DUF2505 domain-containing protein [Bifidobacteriaceae bacterium]
MRFAAHYDYEAEPQTVAELLRNREYLLAAATAAGAEASQVEVSPGPGNGFTVTIRSTMPTAGLPASVRGLLPQGLELRQAFVWEEAADDGSRRATMAGELGGAAVGVTGSAWLNPAGGGSRLEFGGEVKSPVPLVGRVIEEAAVPAIVKVLDTQHRIGVDWLDCSS